MTATINASTSSGVIVTSDTSGNLDFQSNGTSRLSVTSSGISFTSASTAAPAFSAYLNASQTPSSGVATKIQFNAEEFDTNNNFDSTTNYRFTPTVAGYYQINALMSNNGATVSGTNTVYLYKNGAVYKRGWRQDVAGVVAIGISSLVYLNGSTDYVEIYGTVTGLSPTFYGDASATYTWFQGAMVRSA